MNWAPIHVGTFKRPIRFSANLEVALATQQRSSLNNPVFIAIKGVNQRTGVLCLISLIEEGSEGRCGVVTERSKASLKHKSAAAQMLWCNKTHPFPSFHKYHLVGVTDYVLVCCVQILDQNESCL